MAELAIRGYGRLVIGGEERPFSVGTTVQGRLLCELRGIELAEYRDLMAKLFDANGAIQDQDLLRDWLYSALKAGSMRDRVEFTPDETDWLFWSDELPASEWGKFFAVVGALNQTAPAAEGKPEGPKVAKTK